MVEINKQKKLETEVCARLKKKFPFMGDLGAAMLVSADFLLGAASDPAATKVAVYRSTHPIDGDLT